MPPPSPLRRSVLSALALSPFLLAGRLRAQADAQQASTPDVEPRHRLAISWPASMPSDSRGFYPIELLQMALQRAGGVYRLVPARGEMSQARSLREVELDRGIDVAWTFSTRGIEQRLRPIRIPIDRGLLGWRLFLARAGHAAPADERALRAQRLVQGHDWADLTVLAHNGFRVAAASDYGGMFQLLRSGRIDLFPRSVSEIWAELDGPQGEQLQVLAQWALVYPAPVYYFVRRQREDLALMIERGLLECLSDGGMKELFLRHFRRPIQHSKLDSRRQLRLVNPDLDPATPIDQPSLWFSPSLGF